MYLSFELWLIDPTESLQRVNLKFLVGHILTVPLVVSQMGQVCIACVTKLKQNPKFMANLRYPARKCML